MALPRELAAKLGKPIRLLASDSKGEAFAALCAIARLLESHGYTFHTLADHVENGGGHPARLQECDDGRSANPRLVDAVAQRHDRRADRPAQRHVGGRPRP
jgi:hypothetical protein